MRRHQAKIPEPRLPIYSNAEAALANVAPLNNRVIVRRDKPKSEHSGIALVEHDKAHWGTVLAKGPGKKLKNGQYGEMAFDVGDRVLLGHFDDYPHLTAGSEDVIVVREGDILAVQDGK